MWIETKTDLPPHDTEVFGWHPTWVNEDFNPEGVSNCYLASHNEKWQVCRWNNTQDFWDAFEEGSFDMDEQVQAPSHWMQKPTPPKN